MDLADLWQNRRIFRNRSAVERVRNEGNNTRNSVHDLELEVESLRRKTEAILQLLERHLGITREDVQSVAADDPLHTVGPSGVRCTECGRVTNRRHSRCLYCEAELPAV